MKNKSLITIFLGAKQVHLYKDVGMIPYYFSKTLNWNTALAYLSEKKIEEIEYEKYVDLKPIEYSENFIIRWFYICIFLFRISNRYSVVNLYHGGASSYLLILLLKIFGSRSKIYIKMDLNQVAFNKRYYNNFGLRIKTVEFVRKILDGIPDCFSVETKSFFDLLIKENRYKDKLIYVPNGIFDSDFDENIEKDDIILTVGRIGDYEKNNELLVEAILMIPEDKLIGWKIYFVGKVNSDFEKYIKEIYLKNEYLKKYFIFTGEINDKKYLYRLYSKAKIFCLTSRWESFGIVIPEAMNFGNYIITTDFPAAHDMIINKDIGKIISHSAESLRDELINLLDGNVDWRKTNEISQKIAKKFFSWEEIVKNIANKIESI